jgi:hypothetical protein
VKKTLIIAAVALFGLGVSGCDEDNTIGVVDEPPVAPQGIFSITGDGVVHVIWNGLYDPDVRFYNIYRSFDPITDYERIGQVVAEDSGGDLVQYRYDDNSVINGDTVYYYAVSAVDFAGQESELSAEEVWDTPRPESIASVTSNDQHEGLFAGFSFQTGRVVADSAELADIFVDLFDGVYYVNIANLETDLQDFGYTEPIFWNSEQLSFDNISMAPDTGWSELGFVEAIEGHTYIVRTLEGNFAKLRIRDISGGGVITFDWAYQPDPGNPQLSLPNEDGRVESGVTSRRVANASK